MESYKVIAVYADPAGTAFDGADLRFVLHVEDVPNDEFKARFGRDVPPTRLGTLSADEEKASPPKPSPRSWRSSPWRWASAA